MPNIFYHGAKIGENDLKLSVLARKNVFQVFINFRLSNSHWPIGPVGGISPLALHQIYWPRTSDQRLISQTAVVEVMFFVQGSNKD